jgi:hypothetical protein
MDRAVLVPRSAQRAPAGFRPPIDPEPPEIEYAEGAYSEVSAVSEHARVRRPRNTATVHAALKRQNVALYRQATASIERARELSALNAALEETVRRLTQELDCARLLQGTARDVLDDELDSLRGKCSELETINHRLWAVPAKDGAETGLDAV